MRNDPLLANPSLRSSGGAASPLTIGGIAGLAALILYVVTCSPGVEWQDSGVHQYRIITGTLENPLGLALSHPLHYWLGRLFLHLPVGDGAYCLNLLAAVSGATAIGLLAGVLATVTGRALPALLGAAAAGLAHTFWQMSVVTETYTLAAALMAAEWLILLAFARRNRLALLVALFAVSGLHVANHLLGLLTLVTYVVLLLERVVRRRIPAAAIPACAVAWLLASSPYWLLVLAHFRENGNLGATLYSAFFGAGTTGGGYARHVLNCKLSLALLKNTVLLAGYNFPSLVLPLALFGMVRSPRRRGRLWYGVLLAQTAIVVVFVGRYNIADQFTFFVPVCLLMGLWFGLGVWRLLLVLPPQWARPLNVVLLLNGLLPVAVYSTFPGLAAQRGWLRGGMRDLPYRDEYAHFLQPWKAGDESAARYAQAALGQAGIGGWILGDVTTAYPVAVYQRLHGGPADIRVFANERCLTAPWSPLLTREAIAAELRRNGSVLAVPSIDAQALLGDAFAWTPEGDFWRVELPPSSAPAAPGK